MCCFDISPPFHHIFLHQQCDSFHCVLYLIFIVFCDINENSNTALFHFVLNSIRINLICNLLYKTFVKCFHHFCTKWVLLEFTLPTLEWPNAKRWTKNKLSGTLIIHFDFSPQGNEINAYHSLRRRMTSIARFNTSRFKDASMNNSYPSF